MLATSAGLSGVGYPLKAVNQNKSTHCHDRKNTIGHDNRNSNQFQNLSHLRIYLVSIAHQAETVSYYLSHNLLLLGSFLNRDRETKASVQYLEPQTLN